MKYVLVAALLLSSTSVFGGQVKCRATINDYENKGKEVAESEFELDFSREGDTKTFAAKYGPLEVLFQASAADLPNYNSVILEIYDTHAIDDLSKKELKGHRLGITGSALPKDLSVLPFGMFDDELTVRIPATAVLTATLMCSAHAKQE
jgi:hypothetical protein